MNNTFAISVMVLALSMSFLWSILTFRKLKYQIMATIIWKKNILSIVIILSLGVCKKYTIVFCWFSSYSHKIFQVLALFFKIIWPCCSFANQHQILLILCGEHFLHKLIKTSLKPFSFFAVLKQKTKNCSNKYQKSRDMYLAS